MESLFCDAAVLVHDLTHGLVHVDPRSHNRSQFRCSVGATTQARRVTQGLRDGMKLLLHGLDLGVVEGVGAITADVQRRRTGTGQLEGHQQNGPDPLVSGGGSR